MVTSYTINSIDAIPFKQNSNQPINNYDKKECKAYISYEEKQFNLKFSTYVNKFDDLRNIDKSVSYHKENQTYTFSMENFKKFWLYFTKIISVTSRSTRCDTHIL